MATAAELAIILSAKDRASGQFRKLQKQLTAVQKSASTMSKSFKVLTPVLGTASGGLGGAVISAGFGFNIMKENAQLAFTTLLKDGGKAAAMIATIEDTAKSTPFKFEELVRGSQRMLAFGFAAEEVIPTLTTIGDAVAAMGGSAEMLDRVVLAFGQMQAKGKVSGEEMLQLTEAGIPAWQILAENVEQISPRLAEAARAGKITQQQVVSSLMKMGEQGKIKAPQALAALRAGMASRFGGLGKKAGEETTGGAFSNLIDSFQQLAGALTEGPFAQAAGILRGVAGALNTMKEVFQGLPPGIKEAVGWFAAFVLAATTIVGAVLGAGGLLAALGMPGLLGVLGTVASFIGGAFMVALGIILSPLGLIVLAVAGLALAWATNFLGIRDITASVVAAVGQVIAAGWGYVLTLFSWLVDTAGSVLHAGWTYVGGLFRWLVDAAGTVLGLGWAYVVAQYTWMTETAGSIVSGAWGYVVSLFGWLVDTAGSVLYAGWTYVAGLFTWLTETAGAVLSGGWGFVASLFGWLTSTAGTTVWGGWTYVVSLFAWLVDTAKSIVANGWGAVYGSFVWLIETAWGYIAHGWQQVAGWFTWLVDTAKGIVSSGWNEVYGFFYGLYASAVNTIADLAKGVVGWWNWMIETLRASPLGQIIETARRLLGGGGGGGGVAQGWVNGVPQLASGGLITASGLAMLHAGETVVPAGVRGGGGQIVFNNYGVLAGHDAEAWFRSMMDRTTARGGAG
jgi:tape measure domain-containing protein